MSASLRRTFHGWGGPTESSSNDERSSPDATAARVIEEMKAAWRQGERPIAEDFLSRYPELCSEPQDAVRLIYEEICLRQECGSEVVSVEVVKRFPQWEAELKFLLDCHGLLQPITS